MEYRMYSVVLRHLSGIQKGIQHGHSKDAFEVIYNQTDEYKEWQKHPTVVVLETHSVALLEAGYDELVAMGIPCAIFFEEDLKGIPTGFSFLASEKVWDTETYPDAPYELSPLTSSSQLTPRQLYEIRQEEQYKANKIVYGEHIAFLRKFRLQYELAKN